VNDLTFVLGRMNERALSLYFDEATLSEFSYPEVGQSMASTFPRSYNNFQKTRRIGSAENFTEFVKEARGWSAQKKSGLKTYPTDSTVGSGSTTLLLLNLGPIQMIAPCRVIHVIEANNLFGFSYGTLPGHPERGEQSIIIERKSEGSFMSIRAFSKPGSLATRISGPIAKKIQSAYNDRYMEALCES
jgi:uncharacterized protein (UPF0548 family)